MKLHRIVCSVLSTLMLAAGALTVRGQAPILNLAQPGTEYSSALLGTSPSIAVYNNMILMAFKGNYSDNSLWTTYSTTAGAFTNPGTNIKAINMLPGTAPALIAWNNALWMAYTGADGYVYLSTSTDGYGKVWSIAIRAVPCVGCTAVQSTSQPSVAVYAGQLWITWSNSTGVQFATYTGSTWVLNQGCGASGPTPLAGTTVGLALFKNYLYFAYGANQAGNYELVVCHTNGLASGNPAGFATTVLYPSLQVGGGISIYADVNSMYLAYKDISTSDYIHVTGTQDGSSYTSTTYTGIRENGDSFTAGGTTVFNGGTKYYFAYVENSSSHHLWVSTASYPY